ncbi:globin [Halioxenophilus sp. WMMB6]|uniref:globin n=1 Tax=Halioxenophilus sp. WMMB6 TaxID=3073815 RepID=UPI00295E29C2|nr:globin [Halioxenophilus sp. WMMB6]
MSTSRTDLNYEQRFNDSVDKLMGHGCYNVELIEDFYRIFLAKSDVVANLFAHTNMSAQKTMLHDSLETLIDFSRTKEISPALEKLAQAHGKRGKNVPTYLFDVWLDSLMEALYLRDNSFTDKDELAWRLTLAPGITYVKFICKK